MINEKVAIIGDSNINRIQNTPGGMQSVVLHSFPGAKLYHCSQLFPKGEFQNTPSQVIISLGINNRDCKENTLTDQIKRLINSAVNYFPKSKIFFPLINYSAKLSFAQRQHLDFLNKEIEQNCTLHKSKRVKSIPILPKMRGSVQIKKILLIFTGQRSLLTKY